MIYEGADAVLLRMMDANDAPDGSSLNSSGRVHMEHVVKEVVKLSDGTMTLKVQHEGNIS